MSVNKFFSTVIMTITCVITIAFVGVFIYPISRVFIADQFVVPTWSMAPTLMAGDRVLVNKCLFGPRIYTDFDFKEEGQELKSFRLKGLRELQHNDVVAFNYPINGNKIAFKINYVYCKRVVALPGDSLSIVNGHYRNNNYKGILGVESEQTRLEALPDSIFFEQALYFLSDKRTGQTIRNMEPFYIPRKGDIIELTSKEVLYYKRILEYETAGDITYDYSGIKLNGKPYEMHTFCHNYYFMAGDNVCDSSDSRYWGLVPEEYIIGVVDVISYHQDKETGNISKERCLLKVK